ncbi:MAG: hypothetical protein JKY81_08330 [Colwellia sp.]|nr:hypothetical protein [Colwellia sp.]
MSCIDEASDRAVACSNSHFKYAGVYPTVVFNTANDLLYKFDVIVERESGSTGSGYGGMTIYISGGAGGGSIRVKTCIDGVCKTTIVYV